MKQLAVAGAGLFAPGYANLGAWQSGQRDPAEPAPTGEFIDKRTRRRASELSRALADAYGQAVTQGNLVAAEVGSVFGSALGEAGTMIGLLDQMWRGDGALSPMRFATSVHNAAAGVVSITTRNRGFTTSIGADHDTPAMALVEAAAYAHTHDLPVVVACGDEAVPKDLIEDLGGGWGLLACAIALVPETLATPAMPRLAGPFLGEATLPGAEVDSALSHNPVVGLLDLVDAVCRRQHGRVRLDRGRGRGYCADLLPPP